MKTIFATWLATILTSFGAFLLPPSIKSTVLTTNSNAAALNVVTGIVNSILVSSNEHWVSSLNGDATNINVYNAIWPQIANGSILAENSDGDGTIGVTIGSGLAFDGTTLSSTAALTPWTSDIDGAQFRLTNATATFITKVGSVENGWAVLNTNRIIMLRSSTNKDAVFMLGTNVATALTFSNNAALTNSSIQNGQANAPSLAFGPGGNVGIGTNAANAPLEVFSSVSPYIFVSSAGAIASGISLGDNSSGTHQWFLTRNSATAAFQISLLSNTPLVTVSSAGNVGIGTTTPTERLSVQGNATIATNLYVTNNIQSGQNLFFIGDGSLFDGMALINSGVYTWGSSGAGSGITPQASIGLFGVNTNYFGTASTGNGTIVLSNAAYNGFTYYRSNGVTAAQVEAGLNNGDFAKGVLSNVFNIVWKSNNVVFWKISAP